MKRVIKPLMIGCLIFIILFIIAALSGCESIPDEPFIDSKQLVTETDSTIMDVDGNWYNKIKIGNQIWTEPNLIVIHYNDSSDILYPDTDKYMWINSNEGCYAWYNDDSLKNSIYGALYNWKAVMSNKLCPQGYHVPTDMEWQQLEQYLGMSQYDSDRYGFRGNNNEGGQLKGSLYWSDPNIGAIDKYKFNAVPSNIRFYNGEYWPWQYKGIESVTYWTSTMDSTVNLAINRSVETNHGSIRKWRHSTLMGYSVRCIKNK